MGQFAGQDVIVLRKGLETIFNKEMGSFTTMHPLVMDMMQVVNNGTNNIEFGWIAQLPKMSKWDGELKLESVDGYYYKLEPEVWHSAIQISKDTYNDDQYGMLAQTVKGMVDQAKRLDIDKFIELLDQGETLKGFAEPGNATFFSTNHQWKGFTTAQSNLLTGTGVATSNDIKADLYRALLALQGFKGDKGNLINSSTSERVLKLIAPTNLRAVIDEALKADQIGNTTNVSKGIASVEYFSGFSDANDWYVLDVTPGGAVKPLIKNNRENPTFVSLDRETDYNVVHNRMYVYKVELRAGWGYGHWTKAVKIKN